MEAVFMYQQHIGTHCYHSWRQQQMLINLNQTWMACFHKHQTMTFKKVLVSFKNTIALKNIFFLPRNFSCSIVKCYECLSCCSTMTIMSGTCLSFYNLHLLTFLMGSHCQIMEIPFSNRLNFPLSV